MRLFFGVLSIYLFLIVGMICLAAILVGGRIEPYALTSASILSGNTTIATMVIDLGRTASVPRDICIAESRTKTVWIANCYKIINPTRMLITHVTILSIEGFRQVRISGTIFEAAIEEGSPRSTGFEYSYLNSDRLNLVGKVIEVPEQGLVILIDAKA